MHQKEIPGRIVNTLRNFIKEKKFKYQFVIISNMGGNVPQAIKDAVLREWLQGTSRYEISISNDISTGSVSKIIDQYRDEIPDLDMMRQIALMVKKKELDLKDIASAVRLKKMLDKFNLPQEKVEEFIEGINIFCFKKGYEINDFLSKIDEVFNLLSNIELPLEDFPVYIEEAQKEKKSLDKEIDSNRKSIEKFNETYGITIEQFEKSRSGRHLQEVVINQRQELMKMNDDIRLLKEENIELCCDIIVSEHISELKKELEGANKKLEEDDYYNIGPQQLDG
jgi:hypothetical protein